jgi:hypothetical protein
MVRVPRETDRFFEADKAYFDYGVPGAYRLEESYGEFWCKAVFTNPDTQEVFAVGLGRQNAVVPWEQHPVCMTVNEWRAGFWLRTFREEVGQ